MRKEHVGEYDIRCRHREIDRALFLSASVCLSDYRKCGELEESPSFGDAPVLREILCRFQYGIDLKRGFRYGRRSCQSWNLLFHGYEKGSRLTGILLHYRHSRDGRR